MCDLFSIVVVGLQQSAHEGEANRAWHAAENLLCVQDLEIIKGYVPGYHGVLGHEFVGIVEECEDSKWQGKRVVGEINCLCELYDHPDPVMVRNHAPKRTVLGIISKDGCMGQFITLPTGNLHLVPSDLSDQEACFAEPLAAACRISEQQVL